MKMEFNLEGMSSLQNEIKTNILPNWKRGNTGYMYEKLHNNGLIGKMKNPIRLYYKSHAYCTRNGYEA